MRAEIKHLRNPTALRGVSLYDRIKNKGIFNSFLKHSQHVWIGSFDGEVSCVWGVVLPTLLSTQAYLWLHVDEEKVAGNQFLFVRHSQRVVEELLKDFEIILGVTHCEAQRSIRWLKWLGAQFAEPEGKLIPFTIRRPNG